MKRCYACGETKPPGAYSVSRRRSDGLQAACKACQSAQRRQWLDRNPEMHASYEAARRQQQRRRMPWFDPDEVHRYYRTAAALRAMSLDIVVDHLCPLRSRQVCGLHTQHNLRLCFAGPNNRKSNLHWPDDTRPVLGQFRRLSVS